MYEIKYRDKNELLDSNEITVGKIPIGWKLVPLKTLLKNKENNIRVGPFGSHLKNSDMNGDFAKVYSQRNVLADDYSLSEDYITKNKYQELISFAVNSGSVLVTTRGSIGKISIVPEHIDIGILHPCLIMMSINSEKYDLKLLKLLFNESGIIEKQVKYLSNSTIIDVIYSYTLKELKIPLSDVCEQQKIVDFLDIKTAQFDQIISKKEQLIEKLEEAKKSLISEVVTGKVKIVDGQLVERDASEMKNSGVEWLGMIPEEWNLFRAKYIWKKEKRKLKEEYGVVTAFRDGQVTLRSNRRTDGFTFAIKEIGYQGVLKGDLVISAMDAFAGAMGISESEGKCSPVYSVCSPLLNINRDYYGYIMQEISNKNYILSLAKGIRERSTDFRYSDFGNIIMPCPKRQTQDEISGHLNKEFLKVNEVIKKEKVILEKLKQAKKSLISEAITGKIDLRDWEIIEEGEMQ